MGSTAAERFLALSIAGARKTLYVTNRSWLERIAERASSLIGRLLYHGTEHAATTIGSGFATAQGARRCRHWLPRVAAGSSAC